MTSHMYFHIDHDIMSHMYFHLYHVKMVTMVCSDQVAESHVANLKKQLRRNNKLSGLPLDCTHTSMTYPLCLIYS